MSTRKKDFANGELYHVYNRGVDKRIIFDDEYDLRRFFKSLIEFNVVDPIGSLYANSFELSCPTPKSKEKGKLVNIVAYCLNPNHFHLILEQLKEGGISEFMKRMGGYTNHFNHKNKRSGSLFQGKFKAKHIDSNEYLLHLSAYVNLNDRVHRLDSQLSGPTPKSSWEEYVDEKISGICEKGIILEQFKNKDEYRKFALESLELILKRKEELKDIRDLLLE